jgi:hypothetical protein
MHCSDDIGSVGIGVGKFETFSIDEEEMVGLNDNVGIKVKLGCNVGLKVKLGVGVGCNVGNDDNSELVDEDVGDNVGNIV